jgi:3-hydroxybutyryl-CoA dehydrogenase
MAEEKGEGRKRDAILIVGGGLMGCGIATVSALAGNRTLIYESYQPRLPEIKEAVRKNLDNLIEYALCTAKAADDAFAMVSLAGDLEESLASSKAVIEAISERLPDKQELFAFMDAHTPVEVLLLSNTSGLRITDIAKKVTHPERCFTTHFWLPAHLIPLVEVVIGDKSSPTLAETVADMLRSWGKSPVIVRRDLPGQLANRILQAIIRESVNIVEMGLASAEDVDTAVKMGMALRFPVWGPLEHVDAVGFDICAPVQNTVLPGISNRTDASPLFAQKMARGESGYKSGKGFYDWSRKDMDALVKRRNDFIVHALKKVREK